MYLTAEIQPENETSTASDIPSEKEAGDVEETRQHDTARLDGAAQRRTV
jgi:hypothetical protein